MKQENIKIGQLLRLKKDRQIDYGLQTNLIKVDGFKAKGKGYKAKWIVHIVLPGEINSADTPATHWYFRASDFIGEIAS